MNINDYLAKQYPTPPCWALVADVYHNELALPVTEFKTVDKSVRGIAAAFRLHLSKGTHGFSRITELQDYAVVLLGKSSEIGMHHCGIFYDGKLLHALESGVYYDDFSGVQDSYALIEYWSR